MSNSTRKILKSLKNVSFKQEDFIMIGEFEIPIVSRSIGESNKIMTSLLSSIKTISTKNFFSPSSFAV